MRARIGLNFFFFFWPYYNYKQLLQLHKLQLATGGKLRGKGDCHHHPSPKGPSTSSTLKGLIKADLRTNFGRNPMNIHGVMTDYLRKIRSKVCHAYRVNSSEESVEN